MNDVQNRILSVALFFITFLGVCWLLRPGYTEDATLRAKVEYFRQHKDEFDFLFLGSSRIYRCFNSKEFDQHLAAAGIKNRSYNIAFQYHRPHEMNVLLREILASKPKRLKFVAVELMDWNPTILSAMRSHDRTPAWHTPRETWAACWTIAAAKEPLEKKIQWWTIHLSNLVARSINHGGGSRWLRQRFSAKSDEREHQRLLKKMERGDGFVALDDETEEVYAMRYNRFREQFWEIFWEQVQVIPDKNQQAGTLDHFNLAAQLDQQKVIQEAGAGALFVIPTVRQGTPVMNQLSRHVDHFMSYNHPLKWPHLYRRNRYWDRRHMNRRGASEFTKVFADNFIQWHRTHRKGV